MFSTRLRAFYNPMISFLPNLGLAAVLLVGGRQVDQRLDHAGRVRHLQHLPADADVPDADARHRARHGAAGGRVGQPRVRDPRPRAARSTAPPTPRPLPAGGGRVQLRPRDALLRRRRARARGRRPRRRRRRDGRDRRADRLGQDDAGRGGRAPLRPDRAAAVSIDGVDVRELDPAELRHADRARPRRRLPVLGDACARTSPTRGPEATLRARSRLAARRAQIDSFIESLPDGYDTLVGERGLTLSGGQRQRIAIARALVTDPRVLILDDATASVDATTEREIKRALREVMEGRTTFVIAHRLSTIALADRDRRDGGRPRDRVGHARGAARLAARSTREIVDKGLPRLGEALSGLADGEPRRARAGRRGGGRMRLGCQRRRRGQPRPRALRRLRGVAELLRPYRGRVIARVRVAGRWRRRPASLPPTSPSSRSTTASRPATCDALNLIVAAFVVAALVYWGATYLQTYLVGWVGQRALQDLRLRIFSHLQRQSIGFFSRRKTGVLISRLTNDVAGARPARHGRHRDALLEHADAGRHGRDPAAARRRAGARHVPGDVPAAGGRQRRVPLLRGRRLPARAREDRERHRLPAGDAVGRADRARVRPGAAARASASPS